MVTKDPFSTALILYVAISAAFLLVLAAHSAFAMKQVYDCELISGTACEWILVPVGVRK